MKTIEEYAADIERDGFTVIPGVFESEQLEASRAAVDSIFAAEAKIGEARGWHNSSFRVSYLLPQKHALFRSIGGNERLLPIVRRILGDDCALGAVNGLSMRPHGEPQPLHIDAPETTPGTCIYLNAVHLLDDFTRINGGTRLVPGSHKSARRRGQSAEVFESQAVYTEASAGSVILYDGGLLHGGSRNETDRPRRALHLYFHRSWARPDWDYPRSLSRHVRRAMSQEEKALFGYANLPMRYDAVTHDWVSSLPDRPLAFATRKLFYRLRHRLGF
jgi:ectoine hydroxylase-related dioxygenase (phytanoyl-CoA dioxygenase family)